MKTSIGHLVARWTLAAGAVVAPVAIVASGGSQAQSAALAGSQGTDTSLPLTDSAVTVSGRGAFAGLRVTVNQTRNLANQAVSITWTGGTPTRDAPRPFSAHYLQIFQCWGDPDGTNPANPGPPPEQCVGGASAGTIGGGANSILVPGGSLVLDRVIKQAAWAPIDPPMGVVSQLDGQTWLPFRAVDGRTVDVQADLNFAGGVAGNFWLNPYFDIVTTNEVSLGRTALDGSGQALMEMNTGVESSGLGCGQKRQPLPDGSKKVPQCWIVVVPRGEPEDENANTVEQLMGANADDRGVFTSPFGPQAWPNRIAIPLEFNPVDSPCSIDADDRQISGNELAINAVVSWQPVLCGGGQLPPFTYARTGDAGARLQLTRGTADMVAVSRPLAQPADPAREIVYAPLTASGVVIGFNLERTPNSDESKAPPDAQVLRGIRIAELNLTPRLVAKLLTHSYRSSVEITLQRAPYDWVANHPRTLYDDQDFLRFNPEFAQLSAVQIRNLGMLHVPAGNSDAARQLWEWILADPEANAWVNGAADEWGMVMNPAYSVVVAQPVDTFPKADPYCYQALDVTNVPEPYTPPRLCTVDWNPPATGFGNAAANTRRAFDGARIGIPDLISPPTAASQYWRRTEPQAVSQKSFLSVTDSSSAALYGIQTARLSRAGDNGANRVFVAATPAAIAAGVSAMKPGAEPDVLEPAPLDLPADAYPLSTLTYAAIQPLRLDAQARSDYAAFIEYAVSTGQRPGEQTGELPRGYAPLPQTLAAQATAAATTVRTLTLPAPTTTTTTTTTVATTQASTTTTTVASGQSGSGQTPVFSSSGGGSSSGSSSGSSRTGSATATTTATTSTTTTLPPATTEPAATTEPPATSEAPAATTVPPAPEAPPATAPVAVTPDTDVSPTRYAMAGFTGTGLLAALVILEITKRPRQRIAQGTSAVDLS